MVIGPALVVVLAAALVAGLVLVASGTRPPNHGAVPSPAASDWAALYRPLHLPALAPGGACPITSERTVVAGLPALPGEGPLYPYATDAADGTAYYRPSDAGPEGVLVAWVAAPDLRGPVLVRGRRLDEPGSISFGQAQSPELEISPYDVATPLGTGGWVALETDLTVVHDPGCYAYQLDGPSFSTVIVFAAHPVATLVTALHRPLHLPMLAPGAACPAMGPRRVVAWVGPAIGPGPVYSVGYGPDGTLHWAGATQAGGWYYAKILWLATPQATGPILVRGRQLDGPNELRFGDGADPSPDLVLSAAATVGVSGSILGWRNFVDYTRIRAAGCYAYQVDTATGSQVIVFAGAP